MQFQRKDFKKAIKALRYSFGRENEKKQAPPPGGSQEESLGRSAVFSLVLVVGARPQKSYDFSGAPANPVCSTPNEFYQKLFSNCLLTQTAWRSKS